MQYRQYFGFKREPFSTDLKPSDLMKLPNLESAHARIQYAVDSRGIALLTGEVGSGKSTALRWSCAQFHRSEVLVVPLVAQASSFLELLKAIAGGLGVEARGSSRTRLIKDIKDSIVELAQSKRQKVMLTIDECHLLRTDVFAEFHTLTQFDFDSKNLLTVVFCGQESVLEKLRYRNSAPIASRIIAKGHLSPLTRRQMEEYLEHHQKIAGLRSSLFDEPVKGAIFQGSGGIPRKANLLARGALIAACQSKKEQVNVEHVRIAASELI
jgi:general secretion pathway protein A